MTKLQRILLTAGIVALIGFGAYMWWEHYSFDDKYDYKVKGSSFKINGPHSGSFGFDLEVTNKFGTSGTLEQYVLKVSVNGTDIADIVSTKSVYLPNGVPAILNIVGNFDPLYSFKTLANLQTIIMAITKPQTVDIRIYGTFDLKVKNVPIKGLPFDVHMSLLDFLPS